VLSEGSVQGVGDIFKVQSSRMKIWNNEIRKPGKQE
jgi:hypothetical protein